MNDIVLRQIILAHKQLEGETYRSLGECIRLFETFFLMYSRRMNKEHPKLKTATIKDIILSFDELLCIENCEEIFERYFNQDFWDGCDYSIRHFTSGDIQLLRLYETENY